MRLLPDRGEGIGDDGDEQVQEPEVEDDDGDDEEEAGDEVFGVDH